MNVPSEILWGIAAFFAAKVVEYLLSLMRKTQEVKEAELQSLKANVQELVKVVGELRFAVDSLDRKVAIVPKLSDDVRKAYDELKTIRLQLPRREV